MEAYEGPPAEPSTASSAIDAASLRPASAHLAKARRALEAHLRPLFRLSYAEVPLERLFAIFQVVATIGLAYGSIELVLVGFRASLARGLAHALVAPAFFVGGVAALRIGLAFVLALVRIADNMEGVAGTMEDLGELPR